MNEIIADLKYYIYINKIFAILFQVEFQEGGSISCLLCVVRQGDFPENESENRIIQL